MSFRAQMAARKRAATDTVEPSAKRAAVDAVESKEAPADTQSTSIVQPVSSTHPPPATSLAPMSAEEEKQLVAVTDAAVKANTAVATVNNESSVVLVAKQEEDPDYNVRIFNVFGIRGLYINRQNKFYFDLKRQANDKGQGKEAFPWFFNIWPKGGIPRVWPHLKRDLNGCVFILPLARISHVMLPPLGSLVMQGAAKLDKPNFHKMEWELGVCAEPLFEEPGLDKNPYFMAAMAKFHELYQIPIITEFEQKEWHIKNGKELPYKLFDPQSTEIKASRKAWRESWHSTADIKFVDSDEHKAIVNSHRNYKHAAKLDDDDGKSYVYDTSPCFFRVNHARQGTTLPTLEEMSPLEQSEIHIGDACHMAVRASLGTKGVGGTENRFDFDLLGAIWFGDADVLFRGRRNMKGDDILNNAEAARPGNPQAFYDALRPEEIKAIKDQEAMMAQAERRKQIATKQ